MFLIDVYLDRSQLQGIGVFARQSISKGSVIWRFDPRFDRLISNEDWESTDGAVKSYLDRYCYPSRANPGHIVFEGDDARYMNHADAPNCDFSREDEARAIKDIVAGEELTCDYNVFFENGFEFLGDR